MPRTNQQRIKDLEDRVTELNELLKLTANTLTEFIASVQAPVYRKQRIINLTREIKGMMK